MNWLSSELVAIADRDSLPSDHGLRLAASDLEKAVQGFYAEPPLVSHRQYLGAYGRAKIAIARYEHGGKEE